MATPASCQLSAAASPLKIVLVEGQGAANNIQQRTPRDIIVRIEDENQRPLSGVSVAFTLPSQGASGSFVNGDKTLVITTGPEGQAAARGFKPNNVAGKLEIRVNASYQGRTASAVVTQFNIAVQSSKPGGSKKWVAILVAAGAAGAAGAVLAGRGSSPSPTPTTPTPPPVISISAGSGTVGPPQ